MLKCLTIKAFINYHLFFILFSCTLVTHAILLCLTPKFDLSVPISLRITSLMLPAFFPVFLVTIIFSGEVQSILHNNLATLLGKHRLAWTQSIYIAPDIKWKYHWCHSWRNVGPMSWVSRTRLIGYQNFCMLQ